MLLDPPPAAAEAALLLDDPGVPLLDADVTGLEHGYVAAALAAGEIGPTGVFRERFERQWAERNGVRYAVSLSSGTAALHVALAALGIGRGDEVIVPAMTYVACANAVLHAGAAPVFVDVDPQTWCLDPARVEAALTPRTRAIMPVHLFGQPAPVDELAEIARSRGLAIVSDCAHAPLGRYRGRSLAAQADVAVNSFFHNKTLTCGEGGALLTDDRAIAHAAYQLRAHGLDIGGGPTHRRLGYNFRLTNLACAILCGQLDRADLILAKGRTIDRLYRKRLAAHPALRLQTQRDCAPHERVHWLFPVLLPSSLAPAAAIAGLKTEGVGARPMFPLPGAVSHLRPYVEAAPHATPVAEALSRTGVLLPLRSTMDPDDVERVVDALVGVASPAVDSRAPVD